MHRFAHLLRRGGYGDTVAQWHDAALHRAALNAGANLVGLVVVAVAGVSVVNDLSGTPARAARPPRAARTA